MWSGSPKTCQWERFSAKSHLDLASETPLLGPSKATFLMLHSKEYFCRLCHLDDGRCALSALEINHTIRARRKRHGCFEMCLKRVTIDRGSIGGKPPDWPTSTPSILTHNIMPFHSFFSRKGYDRIDSLITKYAFPTGGFSVDKCPASFPRQPRNNWSVESGLADPCKASKEILSRNSRRHSHRSTQYPVTEAGHRGVGQTRKHTIYLRGSWWGCLQAPISLAPRG